MQSEKGQNIKLRSFLNHPPSSTHGQVILFPNSIFCQKKGLACLSTSKTNYDFPTSIGCYSKLLFKLEVSDVFWS